MRQTLRRSLLFCTVLSLGAPVASFAGTYYLVATTINGANTKIDVNSTSIWTFTPGISFDLGGGALVMKDFPVANGTTADLTLTLYDLTTSVRIQSMAVGQFNNQFNEYNSSGYGSEYLFFVHTSSSLLTHAGALADINPYPITLTAGHSYTLTLTSLQDPVHAYFIKGVSTSSTFGFVSDPSCTLGAGACTNETPLNVPVNTEYTVPEPDSLALLGGGVLLVGLGTYSKRKARK